MNSGRWRRRILQASAAAVVLQDHTCCRAADLTRNSTNQNVEIQEPICMLHLVTKHTAVTRQTQAAKSHPFGSNTLHLVPVEHLRNLLARHPAAVGVEWISHVWDLFLPVFLVNRQALFSAGSLSLLKG
ncbi:TPA: hypothetical protein ACH3X1_011616 [Trebouxia sp. C0004]